MYVIKGRSVVNLVVSEPAVCPVTSPRRNAEISSMSLSRSWASCCRATPAKWTSPRFYRRVSTFCTNTRVRNCHGSPITCLSWSFDRIVGGFLDRLLTCSVPPLSEFAAHSESTEIRQDWKPPFLSNEEFTQLMLEVRTRLNMSMICTCSFLFAYKQQYVLKIHRVFFFFLSGIRWIFPCNND